MVALDNGQTRHVKYNVHTGEAWWSRNLEWRKIMETGPISNSTYDFLVVSRGLTWRTIRLDKLSGQAWKLSDSQWIKFTHGSK